MRLKAALLGAVCVAVSAVAAPAQPAKGPSGSIVVKGVVASAKGPLSGVTVVLSPVDATSGFAVTVYGPRDSKGDAEIANPKVQADAKGAFSVSVPRSLFVQPPPCSKECIQWPADKLSIAVWPKAGTKADPLESKTVTIDPKAPTVDVGEIVFVPMD